MSELTREELDRLVADAPPVREVFPLPAPGFADESERRRWALDVVDALVAERFVADDPGDRRVAVARLEAVVGVELPDPGVLMRWVLVAGLEHEFVVANVRSVGDDDVGAEEFDLVDLVVTTEAGESGREMASAFERNGVPGAAGLDFAVLEDAESGTETLVVSIRAAVVREVRQVGPAVLLASAVGTQLGMATSSLVGLQALLTSDEFGEWLDAVAVATPR